MGISRRAKTEFGDFQTPPWFCEAICTMLVKKGLNPSGILEPTCGQGNFLLAALDHFPSTNVAVGIDINSEYIDLLQQKAISRVDKDKIEVCHADFFKTDWRQILNNLPEPLLIIGNPPWVTNSQLSTMQSGNLPKKNNFQNQSGIDAITGASNFDISEWMILKIFEWASDKQSVVAVLCKTSVARKVLLHTWRNSIHSGNSQIFMIDSKKIFDASVDACLLIHDTVKKTSAKSCEVFSDLSNESYLSTIGYRNGQIIANLEYFERWKHLQNKSKTNEYNWRSGVKHDCTKVMELKKVGDMFVNKLNEMYELESTYVYPMLKSSDLTNDFSKINSRWMLVTQKSVGESTATIKAKAPKTWSYLTEHHNYLDKRKSSIYKDRPPYSIFGVGDYSFSPWKVAISGLYKNLKFVVVGPIEGKPTVLDDTCYFLPCKSKEEAEFIAKLLNSEIAQQFFQSFIFWDSKRPKTAKILNRLNIYALAKELGCIEKFKTLSMSWRDGSQAKQLRLLEKPPSYANKRTSHADDLEQKAHPPDQR